MEIDEAEKFTSEMHDLCARSRCQQERTTQKHLQKAPVWSQPNTLRRLSQKCFYNSRVLEKGQSRVPFYEDVGAFYSSEFLPPFLIEQVFSLQSKSYPCRASLTLAEQVFSLQSKSLSCRASFQESETQWASLGLCFVRGPHKGWALPSLGLWRWACWARQALSHIISSSAAPFTPFGPSLLCKQSIGVTVKTNNNDGPVIMEVTDMRK